MSKEMLFPKISIKNKWSPNDKKTFEKLSSDSFNKKKLSKYKKYTYSELSELSFSLNDEFITPYSYPELFYWDERSKKPQRIYTADIPAKLIQYFETEINLTPNSDWFIEKNEFQTIEKFCAMNWFSNKNSLLRYSYKHPELEYALELCKTIQASRIINWTLLWVYSGWMWIFMTKNLTEYKDSFDINSNLNLTVNKWLDFSSLSNEQIMKYISNPEVLKSELRSSVVKEIDSNTLDFKE